MPMIPDYGILPVMSLTSERRVIVIGGGHAGAEAASAAARIGAQVTLITLRREGIGQMSCNPAIGGLGKGHIVKEVDALGGLMGRAIDKTGIQFRTLNTSKGPAVRASRAQADRDLYKNEIRALIESQPNITILEGKVAGIETEGEKFSTVILEDGTKVPGDSVVVTTGTFLRGLMHVGESQSCGGRQGDQASNTLSDSLKSLGFELQRLKTGTPPRLKLSSIDFSVLEEQPGDTPPKPFSMMTDEISQPQISCWITETNPEVHDIIVSNKDRSPMFNGQIQSGGPRYCPSIEDKVFRFSDKPKHNIFLEPEGYDSDLVYPNGISTSLPLDVQEEFVRKIKGLENVEIVQAGYAVEYDAIDPRVLKPTLESKEIAGLFFAGQINGTSGYEEAAGQGLVAGANAALRLSKQDGFVLSRGEAYIGVMIDDLINNGVDEPYRMFTSRAEYRLVLREDNAATRLCPRGIETGLIEESQRARYEERENRYQEAKKLCSSTKIKTSDETNRWLESLGSSPLKNTQSVAEIMRRPELSLESVFNFAGLSEELQLSEDLRDILEIELKFSGYLKRQEEEILKLKKVEGELIPEGFNFDQIHNLRTEFIEKLKKYQPRSVGQAMRIPGITPTAVSLLAVYVKKYSREAA